MTIPERLKRLNGELTNGRRTDVLHAVGDTYRIAMVVRRNHDIQRHWPEERDFTAMARIDGREIVEHGMLPSIAISRLVVALGREVGERTEATATNNDLPSIEEV